MKESNRDGIETCEDACACGARLRLHTYTFGKDTKSPHTKYYIDCEKHCGKVTDWHDSPDAAIEAFDKEFMT